MFLQFPGPKLPYDQQSGMHYDRDVQAPDLNIAHPETHHIYLLYYGFIS